jgi:hypothetical protein
MVLRPMNSERSTFRTAAAHWRKGLAASLLVPALLLPAAAQVIQPEVENGHVVWTNDAPPPARTASHRSGSRVSHYSYWSKSERRWKPVKSASPRAMRSARAVAGEVSHYVAHGKKGTDMARDGIVTPVEIDRYIEEAAARHNVDPNLVRAVIKVESNFNPRAVSRKGAMGLMQLMPATARKYDVNNPFDAKQNVEAGVRHLKGLLENYDGNVQLTLAAYNAGEGAVKRNGGIPPYTETRNYVRRITHLLEGGAPSYTASTSTPIRVYRDEQGKLIITNIE